ncbi:MAG: prepilin-type N-terminal cleavage/methylation domain-containing protein [Phycisphaerales bacterium]|nr:prepilin-type N-terminal cleavage/methylation domain-containing protein [Phycisphaerales bacterium]
MNTQHTTQVGSMSIRRAAFTLVEVLVVIVIGLILLTIAVPAFQSLIDSSERSLAVNSVQAAVQAAQDLALEGKEGEDGAIVFLVDDNGRLTMVPAVKIGSYREPYLSPPGDIGSQSFDYDYVVIEVFSPLDTGTSIQLPKSWFVRGYAPIGSMIDKFVPADINADRSIAIWYNSPMYGGSDINSPIKDEGHWVFPETNLFAKDAQHVGGNTDNGSLGSMQSQFRSPRQSFMIRFDGRTGELSRSTTPALFINPRVSRERPFGDRPDIEDRWKRVDLSESTRRWGVRMLLAADTDSNGTQWTNGDQFTRSLWIGNISHDTVLVKAVTRIALYNEQEMARDLGARELNKITGTLYKDYDQDDSESEIEFDIDELWPTNPPSVDNLRIAINRWIQGDTGGPEVNGRPWPDGVIRFTDTEDPDLAVGFDEPLSRLYLIQPYSGKLQEVMR